MAVDHGEQDASMHDPVGVEQAFGHLQPGDGPAGLDILDVHAEEPAQWEVSTVIAVHAPTVASPAGPQAL